MGQLDTLMQRILEPDIPTENLERANEIVCEAIEKLRPLAKGEKPKPKHYAVVIYKGGNLEAEDWTRIGQMLMVGFVKGIGDPQGVNWERIEVL